MTYMPPNSTDGQYVKQERCRSQPHQPHNPSNEKILTWTKEYFGLIREHWTKHVGKELPGIVKAKVMAPELVLGVMNNYSNSVHSPFPILEAVTDAIPELAISLSRFSSISIASIAAAEIGEAIEKTTPTQEQYGKLLTERPELWGSTRLATAVFLPTLLKTPQKLLKGTIAAGGHAIRASLKYVKPSFGTTAKLGCAWAHTVVGKEIGSCIFKSVDEALAERKEQFAEHVKKVRQDYDLSDQQAALYTLAAYDAVSKYLGTEGMLSKIDETEFTKETFKASLKNELRLDASMLDWSALRNDLDGIRADFFSTPKELSLEATLQLYMMGQLSSIYLGDDEAFGRANQMEMPSITQNFDIPAGKPLNEEGMLGAAMQLKQVAALFEQQLNAGELLGNEATLDESIKKLEGFNNDLSSWQTEHEEYLIKKKNEVYALHMTNAALNGFAEWQNAQLMDDVAKHQRSEKIKDIQHQQKLAEQQQFWSHNYAEGMPVGFWVSHEIIKTVQDLNSCLNDLKILQNNYRNIRDSAENKIDALLKEQEKILHSRKRKASGLLKLAKIVLGVVTVVCPPVALGATAITAAEAYSNRKDAKRQMRNEGQANDLQRQVNSYSQTANQANQRLGANNAQANQLLDQIIENSSQFPPQLLREALRKKIEGANKALEECNEKIKTVEAVIEAKRKAYKPDRRNPNKKPPEIEECAEKELLEALKAEGVKEKEGYEKQLSKENEIATFQDYSFGVQTYWIDFWGPKSEQAQNFARAVSFSKECYLKSTAEERETVMQTLQVFDVMGSVIGSNRMRSCALAGRQIYTIFDIARGFHERKHVLFGVMTGQNPIQNLGGPLKLLSEFLVPGMCLVIAAIQLYRIATQENHQYVSREDFVLDHLQNQLGDLCTTINSLVRTNQSQYQHIIKEIETSRLSIKRAQEKLADVMTDEFRIQNQLNNESDYNHVTMILKNDICKFAAGVRDFGREIARQNVTKEGLKAHIRRLNKALFVSPQDFSNGWNAPNFPSYCSLTYRNPFMYTGLTASLLLGSNSSVANLQLFLHAYEGYLAAKEANSILRDADVDSDLERTREELRSQAQKVVDFYEGFPAACDELAKLHAELFNKIGALITSSQRLEESARVERIKAAVKTVESQFDDWCKGESRFGLSTFFSNAKKPHIILPPNYELLHFGDAKLSENWGIKTSNSLWEWRSRTRSHFIIERFVYCYHIWMHQSTARLEGFFKDKLIVDQAEQSDKKDLVLTVNVVARRSLHHLAVSFITFSPHGLRLDKNVDGETCDVMRLDFYADQKGKCSTTPVKSFQITGDDKKEIPEFYPKNTISRSSLEAYFNFIRGYVEEWAGIHKDDCVLIPGNTACMVPLAIPKSILGEYVILERKLAIKGIQLTPLYNFHFVPESNCYRLVVEWRANETLHASMVLAQFDTITVISFGAPIITGDVIAHELSPNHNEFLLHAMYGSNFDVGLPGYQTKMIANRTLVAPVDVAFPGLFHLLKMKKKFEFSHGLYRSAEQLSSEKDAPKFFPEPLKLEVHTTRWDLESNLPLYDISKLYKLYCQKHHAVKAMLSAITVLEPEKIKPMMEYSGFRIPISGIDQEFYDFATYARPNSAQADSLIGGNLTQLAKFGELSHEFKALYCAFHALKQ